MKFALLYAAWPGEGEWSTPKGWQAELKSRGHEVRHFNLYHGDGEVKNKQGHHIYSNEGLNKLIKEYQAETFIPDVIYLMDYGVWDCVYLTKSTFPKSLLITELGDLPQSFNNHRSKYGKFDLYFGPCYQSIELLKQHNNKAFWQTHYADERQFYPRQNVIPAFLVTTTCGSRGKGLTDKLSEVFAKDFSNKRYFYGLDHGDFLAKGQMVFQCSQFGEITRRIFEGMALGRMVITDKLGDHTHLNDLFIENQDIVYYSSVEECIDKIKYYSHRVYEREMIALSGHKKVMAGHTVKARVDEWLKIIEANI